MHIFVQTTDGRRIALEVERSDRTEDVKAKVQIAEGILPDGQCLFFNGRQLRNGTILQDYSIQEESTLYLAWGSPQRISLFIKVYDRLGRGGTSFRFTAAPTDRVEDVKERISGLTGLAVDEVHLIAPMGRILKNGRTLQDYSLPHFSTLFLCRWMA
jgi:hypothetical protein